MARKTRHDRPLEAIYPYTPWEIIESAFQPTHNYRNETIFALANGFIGMRGTFEEGLGDTSISGLEGTYLNGFYETETIKYPEIAYGYAERSQTLLNVTQAKTIQLWINDEPFHMSSGTLLEYDRRLRMDAGVVERKLRWRSPSGQEISLEVTRLVSLERRHVAAIRFRVTAVNVSGHLRFASGMDGDVQNLTANKDPRVGSGLSGRVLTVEAAQAQGTGAVMRQRTQHSGMALACAMEHHLSGASAELSNRQEADALWCDFTCEVMPGQTVTLDKFVVYVSTPDTRHDDLTETAQSLAAEVLAAGFEALQAEQAAFLRSFWESADIEIQGDDALQQGIRFNMFHLLQSVGRDGRTSIAAKGLTGEGYEGHYFWDTEMYVLPFFLYTQPEISRRLLEYRHSILDHARRRARQMAHPRGALFAWRTINGDECSAYYPAGTAQVHINADIAYAVQRYWQITGDMAFMQNAGVEILVETARLWADLGAYIPSKGEQFCINCVTGPDEYTAVVNNNTYTNLMAQHNLHGAAAAWTWLAEIDPARSAQLKAQLGLEDGEPAAWREAAARMYIPYDAETGLYPQDDSFLSKAPWDFENTPEENYPLLLHYHPLVIYRHQVCKQADLVLAMFLLSERFTPDEKRVNYAFYEPLTTHDSSLSTSIFSIIASEIGEHEQAYRFFMNTARLDLDDYHGNVKDGVHIANMAGTWLCLVSGFAGVRVEGGTLRLKPHLPAGWQGYRFRLRLDGAQLEVHVRPGGTRYTLVEGDRLHFQHGDQAVSLRRGGSIDIDER